MLKYKYNYSTRISFTESVYDHSFLLRCTPATNSFQKLVEESLIVNPNAIISSNLDNFGNLIHKGIIQSYHKYFEFISEGTVEFQSYYKLQEPLNNIFLYQSKLTLIDKEIESLYQKTALLLTATIPEKVFSFSTEIHNTFRYESGITTINTTANQALQLGVGVCQDFSHILISLCRKAGIAARYVTGFMIGEGFTHAWVEYYFEGVWYGFDPTHNRPIDTGYIKMAHGRDYNDCVIDRGVFKGRAYQNLEVNLKVEQLEQ